MPIAVSGEFEVINCYMVAVVCKTDVITLHCHGKSKPYYCTPIARKRGAVTKFCCLNYISCIEQPSIHVTWVKVLNLQCSYMPFLLTVIGDSLHDFMHHCSSPCPSA